MINWIYQWYKPDGSLTGEALVQQYTDIFFRGAVDSFQLPVSHFVSHFFQIGHLSACEPKRANSTWSSSASPP